MKNSYSGLSQAAKNLTTLIVALLTIGGCAIISNNPDAEEMYIKASALTKLSSAVEATVRYGPPTESFSDQELLKLATADDPLLLEPFAGYTIKINREFNHAILLVCNPEGTKSLFEDAGCTAPMDKNQWQQKFACVFTMSSAEICK